jgi:hypothetical protein
MVVDLGLEGSRKSISEEIEPDMNGDICLVRNMLYTGDIRAKEEANFSESMWFCENGFEESFVWIKFKQVFNAK